MAPLFVHGYGAVSSAGPTASDLFEACRSQRKIETTPLERENCEKKSSPCLVRRVDQAALKKLLPKLARLRRSSPVTRFAVAAAAEALGPGRIEQIQSGELEIGIVITLLNGCVNYTNRFYTELLSDPALASPIVFPETVFNAPASHVASFAGVRGLTYTLIGDTAAWFSAVQIARGWIDDGLVEGCLVLCSEELDWLTGEGLMMHSKKLVPTEGAAAIYLESHPAKWEINTLSGPFSYRSRKERDKAVHEAARALPEGQYSLLVDGKTGAPIIDRAEIEALKNWKGDRISPLSTVGSGMATNAGFQTIVALEGLKHGYDSASVIASGNNQHAFSAECKTSLES